MKRDFTEMQEAARRIENLAFLLRAAAESGQLYNAGEDVAEDMAAMIQEKAQELGEMIREAAQESTLETE